MATQNAIDTQNPVQVARGGTGLASATAYAVLCGGTTSTGALQSIASVGTAGQALTSNGAGALPTMEDYVASGGEPGSSPVFNSAGVLVAGNPSTYSSFFDDFMYNNTSAQKIEPWTSATSGSATQVNTVTSLVNAPGLLRIETGTASNSATILVRMGPAFGAGAVRFESRVNIGTLSSGTQEYVVCFGFHDAYPGVVAYPTTGVWMEYNRANNVNFKGCTANGGAVSRTTGTDVPPAGGTYEVAFEVNAAGTSVEFWVDGTSIGTLSTAIPTTGAGFTNLYMAKTVGTTERFVLFDYVRTFSEFDTPRY